MHCRRSFGFASLGHKFAILFVQNFLQAFSSVKPRAFQPRCFLVIESSPLLVISTLLHNLVFSQNLFIEVSSPLVPTTQRNPIKAPRTHADLKDSCIVHKIFYVCSLAKQKKQEKLIADSRKLEDLRHELRVLPKIGLDANEFMRLSLKQSGLASQAELEKIDRLFQLFGPDASGRVSQEKLLAGIVLADQALPYR